MACMCHGDLCSAMTIMSMTMLHFLLRYCPVLDMIIQIETDITVNRILHESSFHLSLPKASYDKSTPLRSSKSKKQTAKALMRMCNCTG